MGRLHCTQDPVPEAVGGDMQQLNQLGAQQFSALTEVLFHFLTEPKEVERFLAQLSEFATTNQISLGPLRSIVKSFLLVPNGALKKSLTAEQVRADFLTLGRSPPKVAQSDSPAALHHAHVSFCSLLGLSEEKATYFSEKWKQNAPTLARWAIGQTLMINQLIDMEWKFGVTSGSSELEKVGSIFLQELEVKKLEPHTRNRKSSWTDWELWMRRRTQGHSLRRGEVARCCRLAQNQGVVALP
ncbi:COMM domain-containing protein 7 isoform X2 [Sus scrofa]|uniref:COMM domain-containing protein 7 isoform X2 n=1 Tax=Sus scrofa TaxID=9823 RepID=UPI000A2AF469|nr:COMM domain-containing protein 7 isoform X2 [Sus scrofa]